MFIVIFKPKKSKQIQTYLHLQLEEILCISMPFFSQFFLNVVYVHRNPLEAIVSRLFSLQMSF